MLDSGVFVKLCLELSALITWRLSFITGSFVALFLRHETEDCVITDPTELSSWRHYPFVWVPLHGSLFLFGGATAFSAGRVLYDSLDRGSNSQWVIWIKRSMCSFSMLLKFKLSFVREKMWSTYFIWAFRPRVGENTQHCSFCFSAMWLKRSLY
jgi:hypothetical protein